MGYTAARFVFEEMRIDPAHTIGPLRVNAWVSIVVFLGALAWFLWLGRHGNAGGAARSGRRRRGGHFVQGPRPTPRRLDGPARLDRAPDRTDQEKLTPVTATVPQPLRRRRPRSPARSTSPRSTAAATPRSARSTTSASSSAPRVFTAIMGPSGSGKSTLLHCLAGLDRVTSGSIYLGDVEISGSNEKQLTLIRRDRIGFVFQAYNLIPTLNAEENITLPMALAGKQAGPGVVRADRRDRRVGGPAQAPPERALRWSAAARRGRARARVAART